MLLFRHELKKIAKNLAKIKQFVKFAVSKENF